MSVLINWLNSITVSLTHFAVRFAIAAIILVVGWFLIGFFAKKLANADKMKKYDPTLSTFIYSAVNLGLKILLVVICVTILGVPASSFIALIASAGVAIGLALQGGLSNIAGGIMLLVFRPFKVGDYVVSGGNEGVVTAINIFYTTILTVDNRKVFLPNGGVSNSALVNVTAEEKRRVDLAYVVSFESDLEKAKKVLKLVASSEAKVLKDPETTVLVTEYADGAYKVCLRAWCKTEDYWAVYGSIQDKVKPAFEASGIVLGHPHLNVHVSEK
jgi:small conductance mechanosensitive channel